jgi:uncharacterized protein YndB with AHSA1/START domain
MAAIYFELQQIIDHPAEQVFAALTDFSRHPEWIEEVEATTRLPQLPLRVGSTYEQRAIYNGRSVTIQMKIIGYEPNRLLKLESSGSMPTITSWWLTQTGKSTVVQFEFEGHPGGLYEIVSESIEGQIKRGLEAQLVTLKAFVDKQTS